MFRSLIHTSGDPMLALLRVTLGCIFFAHGAQKVLGWFGGPGYSGALSMFTHSLGIPMFLAVAAIAAEFLGGIGLILGFLSRLAALGIAIVMLVAMFLVHVQHGFFMNWAGNKAGEGFEFHLLAIAIALTIFVRGGGAMSVDHALQSDRIRTDFYPQPLRG